MRARVVAALSAVVVLLAAGLALAASQDKIVGAAEQLVTRWEKIMQAQPVIVHLDSEGGWFGRRFRLAGPVKYDVKKTDSLVAPYKLIVSFYAIETDNQIGPMANGRYYAALKRNVNYRTAAEAARPETFSGCTDIDATIIVLYSYKRGAWSLVGGNRSYQNIFDRGALRLKENSAIYSQIVGIKVR